MQDTVGGVTEGLPVVGGDDEGGGPVDQVQDTVGGLTGGLTGVAETTTKRKVAGAASPGAYCSPAVAMRSVGLIPVSSTAPARSGLRL